MEKSKGEDLAALRRTKFQFARFIAAGFCSSLAIYWLMIYVMLRSGNLPRQQPLDPLIKNAMYLIAMVIPFVAPAINGLMKNRQTVTSLAPEERLVRLQAENIVRFSAAESSAIIGFLLFFMTQDPRHFYLLAGLSLAVMILRWPRWSYWVEVTQAPRVQ